MEIAGLIISILAIIFSLITYLIHDIKIKKQEKLLNEYQLNKIAEEKQESLKASIEANVIKVGGDRIIKFYNKGKSIAKDVEIIIPEIHEIQITDNPCPIDIRPQNGIEILLYLLGGYPNKIEITFKWKDNFKEDNVVTQMLQI